MSARTFRLEKSVAFSGEMTLQSVPLNGSQPRTLELFRPGELEDLFWVLARHLSRTDGDMSGEYGEGRT
jgi:hypothetical protein